jgi:phosphomannomutase
MYGSGNSYIERVLGGANLKIKFLHNQINPSFGGVRPEPIEENLKEIKEILKNKEFDLGIALDGDADRVSAFDSEGRFIHPQKILPLLLIHLLEDRSLKGGVVKTIAGTTLIDKVCKEFGLKLYETPVGFKHISKLMQETDILIGGEEAGGIGFKGYIPERDGTLAGLLLLEMLVYRKKPISKIIEEMEDRFGRYYYLREDIQTNYKLQINKKWRSLREILGRKIIEIKDFDGIKFICDDESWLMLRTSGTERLFRIYAEAKSLKRARELIKFGKDLSLKNEPL